MVLVLGSLVALSLSFKWNCFWAPCLLLPERGFSDEETEWLKIQGRVDHGGLLVTMAETPQLKEFLII